MKNKYNKPTFEEVDSILRYDPYTGKFYWRRSRGNGAYEGMEAGWFTTRGYRCLTIFNKKYKAHHVAWLLTYGKWPEQSIDHINGVTGDNRIANLRLASRSQNTQNSRLRCDNTSGFKGVYKRGRGWFAQIKIGGKYKYLGMWHTPEEAHAAYCEAADRYYGEFANYGR